MFATCWLLRVAQLDTKPLDSAPPPKSGSALAAPMNQYEYTNYHDQHNMLRTPPPSTSKQPGTERTLRTHLIILLVCQVRKRLLAHHLAIIPDLIVRLVLGIHRRINHFCRLAECDASLFVRLVHQEQDENEETVVRQYRFKVEVYIVLKW